MKSPVGRLKLVASERGLAAIQWENDDPKRVRLAPLVEDENHSVLLEAERQLNDYFAGKLKRFSLRFDFAGTEFQKEVWRALAATLAAWRRKPSCWKLNQERSIAQPPPNMTINSESLRESTPDL